jgi:hypothetical protein
MSRGKHPLGCFINIRHMSAEPITTFESSLDEIGVELVQTTSDQFESTLVPLLDAPAVGTRPSTSPARRLRTCSTRTSTRRSLSKLPRS